MHARLRNLQYPTYLVTYEWAQNPYRLSSMGYRGERKRRGKVFCALARHDARNWRVRAVGAQVGIFLDGWVRWVGIDWTGLDGMGWAMRRL